MCHRLIPPGRFERRTVHRRIALCIRADRRLARIVLRRLCARYRRAP